MKKLSSRLLLAGCLLPALAVALPQQADPSDPNAPAPSAVHASPLSGYVPAAARKESPDQLWLENNRKLSASGGMGQMMMAAPHNHDEVVGHSAEPAADHAADHAAAASHAHPHAHAMASPSQPTETTNPKPDARTDVPMDMPMDMKMDMKMDMPDHTHH